MENLPLAIWLFAYPLAMSISNYFDAKRRSLEKKEPYSTQAYLIEFFIELVVYILVAEMLYVS
jgi:hypothetical protein